MRSFRTELLHAPLYVDQNDGSKRPHELLVGVLPLMDGNFLAVFDYFHSNEPCSCCDGGGL